MIKNYFKIAWRTLWKHKAYSAINIIGLSIGLTACLIVATVVIDELSYDHQWKKADDIYRVLSSSNDVKGETPTPMAMAGFAPMLKKDLPEVADYCRMSVSDDRLQLGNDKQGIKFSNLFAEPSIWNILDFKIIKGTPQKYVKGYVNLVITKKIAQQYFSGQNPIGKIVYNQPEYGKPTSYLITGVIDNIPQNTHLRADYITIGEYRESDNRLPRKGEGYTFCPQYVLLKHGVNIQAFTEKVNKWYSRQPGAQVANYSFQFQSIKDVYLRSGNLNGQQAVHGSITNVYIFAGVAALLLLIACVNFINLTISRIFNRSKETGIRKVLGAVKLQLIIRFLSESLIFFTLSFILSIILYPLFLKPVETYLGHQLVVNLYNAGFLVTVISFVFLVSLLTGLYPAWYLSRPKPIVILRNKLSANVQLNALKKGLVIGQFVISVTIIMAAIIVHNQLNFINSKDLGFDKNNLLDISWTSWGDSGAAFKQAVKQLPGVENVSISHWSSGSAGTSSQEIALPGENEKINVYFIEGDADLPATLGLRLKSGRLLNPALATDAMNTDSAMGGTSAATKAMYKTRPLLATSYTANLLDLKLDKPIVGMSGIPVGFIQDFNSESLYAKLQPTFIQAINDSKYGNMLVRVRPGSEKCVLSGINDLYKAFYPEKTFQYSWTSDEINAQYKAEYKLQQLFTCFSVLIIFLACLGLFGLVSFTVEQRVKEIGIRKVLGASVSNVITLVSKDYLSLIMLSVIIASPIAWYAMNKWLQNFAYRTSIQWWVFVLTGMLTLLIGFITVSFQSVKAAIANPVKSLRSE